MSSPFPEAGVCDHTERWECLPFTHGYGESSSGGGEVRGGEGIL